MASENIEREVKFLEIDYEDLKRRLTELHAVDRGDLLMRETIFYDGDSGRPNGLARRYARVRVRGKKITLTYKKLPPEPALEVEEIEFEVSNEQKAIDFMGAMGWEIARVQEKRRHSFTIGEAIIDIDTWPGVPTYAEIEANNVETIKATAEQLGFEWEQALLMSAGDVLKKHYNISVWGLTKFTFAEIK